uniref:Spermidine/putrescine-binding periplasmic protein n=1 Tax=Aliivibrio wodanis TaxID=80852 RepID=A0A5Q4Z418_9GAMM|nr:Spermidine/putrescine-binding periplasmic protein [Aliivibrio wodanis]
MIKNTLIKLLYLLTLFSSNCFALPTEKTLTILNWEDYLSQQVIDKWYLETGVKIEQVLFDNDEKRDHILNTGAGIDIVIIDEVSGHHFMKQKMLASWSPGTISNSKYIEELWLNQCSDNSIPYFWGTLGLAYRSSKIARPTSWKNILYPNDELYSRIMMMDDTSDLLLPSLFIRNASISTVTTHTLKDIYNELKQQSKFVHSYNYPISYFIGNPNDNNIYITMAYSGDEETLNKKSSFSDWKFITPKEGTIVWVDCLSVLESSKNKELAFRFINFLQRPDIALLNTLDLKNNPTNASVSKQLLLLNDNWGASLPTSKVMNLSQEYTYEDINNKYIRKRITESIIKYHEENN